MCESFPADPASVVYWLSHYVKSSTRLGSAKANKPPGQARWGGNIHKLSATPVRVAEQLGYEIRVLNGAITSRRDLVKPKRPPNTLCAGTTDSAVLSKWSCDSQA